MSIERTADRFAAFNCSATVAIGIASSALNTLSAFPGWLGWLGVGGQAFTCVLVIRSIIRDRWS